jgi:hypothetical protein
VVLLRSAFGFVAVLSDPEEPEEPELVGALTAQHSTADDDAGGVAGGDGGLQEAAAAAAAAALGDVADPQLQQQVCTAPCVWWLLAALHCSQIYLPPSAEYWLVTGRFPPSIAVHE